MTPERWQKIDRIFNEVVELSAAGREELLAEKCGGDRVLLREVRNLLRASEKADDFIENSAIRVVAKKLANGRNSAAGSNYLGKSLDNYKIEKLIGEGGMGEVYLAFDEKLRRDVAVKILPPEYTANDERVGRFKREARVISALNHPNIVTVHDVGVSGNVNYIATEFVEGRTLREYVKKGMPLSSILSVVIQCCDALAAAHEAGIIHRDIKPENIVVRPDGYVKILDFGLAKLTDASPVAAEDDQASTVAGNLIGTPAYMSPEQISSDRIDQRADLWSIGLVLYELLTGLNPFKQKNRKKTLQAILNFAPPPASSLNGEVPAELDQILVKALQKDADLSYQSAADLRADLLRIKRELDSLASHNSGSKSFSGRADASRRPVLFGFATLFVLAALASGSAWYFYNGAGIEEEGPDWTKARTVRLTSDAGVEHYPNLAPTGESFVFSAKTDGRFDIFLRRIGGSRAINLTENSAENDTQPVFSPDGKQIAFRSERDGGGIFVMGETGENPRRVCDFGYHPSWSPDGKQIVLAEINQPRPLIRGLSSLWIVETESGKKRRLIGERAYQPSWSPNGKRVAFWGTTGEGSKRVIASVPAQGGEPTVISNPASASWNPVWSPDGRYLYYSSNLSGNMAFWRVRIDESTGRPEGGAEIVPTPGKFNGHLSFSSDGKRLIYVQMNDSSNLKAVDFDPDKRKPVGETFWITRGDHEIYRPRLSPDGRDFVVNLARLTQDDIILIDRRGKNWRDLTNDEYFNRYPTWSPDGKTIAFTSDRSGVNQIWVMNRDGSNQRQITRNKRSTSFPIWSPDGRWLAYRTEKVKSSIIDLTKDPLQQTHRELPVVEGLRSYSFWDWSADGKKLTGRWVVDDRLAGIGYLSLETNEYERLLTGSVSMPRWLPDSRHIIFSYKGKIQILDTETTEFKEIPGLPEKDVGGVGISRDGRLLYYTVSSEESNIWLLDLRE